MSGAIKWIGAGVLVLVVGAIVVCQLEQSSIAMSTTGYTRDGAVMQVLHEKHIFVTALAKLNIIFKSLKGVCSPLL